MIKRAVSVFLLILLLPIWGIAAERAEEDEMEKRINVLRWTIAVLTIELMNVLNAVRQEKQIGIGLRIQIEETITKCYQILEALGIVLRGGGG